MKKVFLVFVAAATLALASCNSNKPAEENTEATTGTEQPSTPTEESNATTETAPADTAQAAAPAESATK